MFDLPEWTTMPGRFQPHDRIAYRQCTQKEHQQKKNEIKVIVT